MTRFLNLVMIFFFLFALIACEKDDKDISKKIFDFKYIVINNLDEEISRLNVESMLYYPIENETHIKYSGKNVQDIYGDNYLYFYDSIIHSYDSVYIDCIIGLGVSVFYIDTNGVERRKHHYIINDTIQSVDYTNLTFIWPNDTVKYIDQIKKN